MEKNVNYRAIQGAVVRQEGEEGRKLTFVASDETRDAAGTVIRADGWDLDRFNKNGIIGYQHKVYGSFEGTDNPDNIIGKGYAYVKGKQLMVDVEFEPADINPLADKIYKKLQFGSLNAVSVGFMATDGEWGEGEESLSGENPTYYYKSQELLEVSVVNIPANKNALKKKSYIQEAMEAEMERLRAEVKAEPEPEPVPDPAPVGEEVKEVDEAEAAQRRLDMTTTIARAALL